jgi:hypothetical protein
MSSAIGPDAIEPEGMVNGQLTVRRHSWIARANTAVRLTHGMRSVPRLRRSVVMSVSSEADPEGGKGSAWVAGVAAQCGGEVDRPSPAERTDRQVAQAGHDLRGGRQDREWVAMGTPERVVLQPAATGLS